MEVPEVGWTEATGWGGTGSEASTSVTTQKSGPHDRQAARGQPVWLCDGDFPSAYVSKEKLLDLFPSEQQPICTEEMCKYERAERPETLSVIVQRKQSCICFQILPVSTRNCPSDGGEVSHKKAAVACTPVHDPQ